MSEEKHRENGVDKLLEELLYYVNEDSTCIEINPWRGDLSEMLLNRLRPSRLILIFQIPTLESKNELLDRVIHFVSDRFGFEKNIGQVEIIKVSASATLSSIEKKSVDFTKALK